MNNKIDNPPGVPPPFGSYSHGIETDPGKRVLCISGQLAVREDGSAPADFAAQAELAFSNMLTVLKGGGMAPEDIVRLGVVPGRWRRSRGLSRGAPPHDPRLREALIDPNLRAVPGLSRMADRNRGLGRASRLGGQRHALNAAGSATSLRHRASMKARSCNRAMHSAGVSRAAVQGSAIEHKFIVTHDARPSS
jgi:hypothetical protein